MSNILYAREGSKGFNISRNINTHIIDHYHPSVRTTTRLLTPLMLCSLILNVTAGTYSLKSILNDKFMRIFHGNFISFAELLPEIYREAVTEEIFSFFRFDL